MQKCTRKLKLSVSYETDLGENMTQQAVTKLEYGNLQRAFDHFNDELFGGTLPNVLLTYTSKSKRTLGYFHPSRFASRQEDTRHHEIAMNPDNFVGESDLEILSTLVHEMAHLWQQEEGKPSRGGYHNKEWGRKMKELGLYPSNTSEPGGKEVGQQMSHYILPGGKYSESYEALAERGFILSLESSVGNRLVKGPKGEPSDRSKRVYVCPGCRSKVWGKPKFPVACIACSTVKGQVVQMIDPLDVKGPEPTNPEPVDPKPTEPAPVDVVEIPLPGEPVEVPTLVQIEMPSTSAALPGCSHIYAPKGQAGEYAPLAANPYRGCGHECRYCYVPNLLKMKREEFDAGAVDRDDYIQLLTKDAKKYQAAGITEQVMLSFTSDPYHPRDTSLTRRTIEVLIEHGLGFCTLTKGGTKSLRDLDLFRPDRDAFASTLTSLDDAFSRKWEASAALPGDRIKALQAFHSCGIFTWVSLEPTLDVESSLAIVRETHSFVDLYKVGRVNYLPMTKTTDWQDYTLRMVDLLQKLGAQAYIKKDLQAYLPAGYVNPLRVQQHH